MANEKALDILKEMKADPKAQELFEGMGQPISPDEVISVYARIAEKLGYGITAEDIRDVIEQEEARRKEEIDKVVADIEALEDDDLEHVAGGYAGQDEECGEAYEYIVEKLKKLTEICWIDDTCDWAIN